MNRLADIALYGLGLIIAINRELCWLIPGYQYLAGTILLLMPKRLFNTLARLDIVAQFKYRY